LLDRPEKRLVVGIYEELVSWLKIIRTGILFSPSLNYQANGPPVQHFPYNTHEKKKQDSLNEVLYMHTRAIRWTGGLLLVNTCVYGIYGADHLVNTGLDRPD